VEVSPADHWSYAYLLGLYLGDGYVRRLARTYQLQVTLDAAYPGIVDECVVAMVMSLPEVTPGVRRHPQDRCTLVTAGSKRWSEFFPQIGPGRKHTRPIFLAPWQETIVEAHPDQFVRGLIHSDGCRSVNRFRTKLPSGRVAEYAYPRYFFSNLSADIRGLFCDACDRLGVRWTQSNHRNISISHRASVAILDELVGPKA
jgi:hypothetical protein